MPFITFFNIIVLMHTFQDKIDSLIKEFSTLSQDEKYARIIQYGQKATNLSKNDQTADRLVSGCQSRLYLKTTLAQSNVLFETASDALISNGLAKLLTHVYSGLSPQEVLTSTPQFFVEMGIYQALSPSRSNGLKALFLKMQQDCIKLLI